MEGNSKKRERNERHEVDRLSQLPGDMLSYIFSFLDMKTAIRTSALSKHYRYAWTYSPSLDLSLFRTPLQHRDYKFFERIVNGILRCRKPYNLTSFRLSLYADVSPELIERCMHYAALHQVQHLRIRATTPLEMPAALPRWPQFSSSLTTLRLNNARLDSIELPRYVFLPNLKILLLKNFVFSSTNYNGLVFSGCPNLEDLVLIKCKIRPRDELKTLDVDCLNLKNLEIRYWRSPVESEHKIIVNAPRLVFFKFQSVVARVHSKSGWPCLDGAYIDLCQRPQGHSERMMIMSESFFSMLCHIRHVKFLSLSFRALQVITAFLHLRDHLMHASENIDNSEREIPIQKYKEILERIGEEIFTLDVAEDPKLLHSAEAAANACLTITVDGFPTTESFSITIPKTHSSLAEQNEESSDKSN